MHYCSGINSVNAHALPLFPVKTSEPQTKEDNEELAASSSSYSISSITQTGVVVRVEFECSSVSKDEFNCDVDHSILIPFGGTGRRKQDGVLYRWEWKNLNPIPSNTINPAGSSD
jgi:hypothetical protein